jgi:hypothetical protein
MVRDAEQYAEKDKERKELIEARNEADTLAYSVDKSLQEYKVGVMVQCSDNGSSLHLKLATPLCVCMQDKLHGWPSGSMCSVGLPWSTVVAQNCCCLQDKHPRC